MQCNPHIVSIYGYITTQDRIIGILMEYCKGGSLDSGIYTLRWWYAFSVIKSDHVYTEREFVWWTLQAACGLKFLHANNIVNRDVKPAKLVVRLYVSSKTRLISRLFSTKCGCTVWQGSENHNRPTAPLMQLAARKSNSPMWIPQNLRTIVIFQHASGREVQSPQDNWSGP